MAHDSEIYQVYCTAYGAKFYHEIFITFITVKTLNIGTPRPATVVVLNIKQFNFTMK